MSDAPFRITTNLGNVFFESPLGDNVTSKYLECRKAGRDMTPGHWFHDSDTGTHMDRVSVASQALATCLAADDFSDFCRIKWPQFPIHVDCDDLIVAAVCHDLGKIDTWVDGKDGRWFPKHEKRSAEIMMEMGFEEDNPAVVLVRLHGQCQEIDKQNDKTVRKLVSKLGSVENQWMYFCLLVADCCGFSVEGRDAGFRKAVLFLRHSDILEEGLARRWKGKKGTGWDFEVQDVGEVEHRLIMYILKIVQDHFFTNEEKGASEYSMLRTGYMGCVLEVQHLPWPARYTEEPEVEPIVLGRHLVEHRFAGCIPGPNFKPILDECLEAQKEGVFDDIEGGLKFLDEILY